MDLETAARLGHTLCHTDFDTTGQRCDLPPRYQHLKRLGGRLDGDCVSALDLIKGYKVAILGIDDICSEDRNVSLNSESYSRPKRLVRHLKLLRHFRAHEGG